MSKKKRKGVDPLKFLKERRAAMRRILRESDPYLQPYRGERLVITYDELRERYECLSEESKVHFDVQLAADLWGHEPEDIIIKYPFGEEEENDG